MRVAAQAEAELPGERRRRDAQRVAFADLRERVQVHDRLAEHADRLARAGHVGHAQREAARVLLHARDEVLERRHAGQLVQQVLAVLRVVVELALVGRGVRGAQARDRVRLVQRQRDREERVVVGDRRRPRGAG